MLRSAKIRNPDYKNMEDTSGINIITAMILYFRE